MAPDDLTAELQAHLQADLFQPFNEQGSECYMTAPARFWLGLIDSWEVVRVAPRRGAAATFWLMFKQTGYDGGPQFTHTVHVVSYRKTADDLKLIDDDGREYSCEFIYGEKLQGWEKWKAEKARRAAEYADIDRALLQEHTELANAW